MSESSLSGVTGGGGGGGGGGAGSVAGGACGVKDSGAAMGGRALVGRSCCAAAPLGGRAEGVVSQGADLERPTRPSVPPPGMPAACGLFVCGLPD